MDSTAIVTAIAGAFLLAGFVKGVIGLGLPTVSIGLLGLLMTPAQAAAILVVPSLVTNIWQAVLGGGLLALARRLWPMLVGICIGTVASVMLLPHDESGRATVWLGLALVIYAAIGLMKGHFVVPPRLETWLGLLMGAATGAITVATGIFVIPGTPYLAGPSIVALAAALVGMWLGRLMRGKIKEETFRVWFFVGLLVLGGHLALRGVL